MTAACDADKVTIEASATVPTSNQPTSTRESFAVIMNPCRIATCEARPSGQ